MKKAIFLTTIFLFGYLFCQEKYYTSEQILNKVFRPGDASLEGRFFTEGQIWNMIYSSTENAIRVYLPSVPEIDPVFQSSAPTTYLYKTEKAVDSDKLDGYDSSYFAIYDDVQLATTSLRIDLNNHISEAEVNFNQIAIDTTSLRNDLNIHILDASNKFEQIAIDTTTLRIDLEAERIERINTDSLIGQTTQQLYEIKVNKSGDVMTGDLVVPQVYTSTITFADGTVLVSTAGLGGADNLGNHIATQDLDMNRYSIKRLHAIDQRGHATSFDVYLKTMSMDYGSGINICDKIEQYGRNDVYGIGIGWSVYNNQYFGVGIGVYAYSNSNYGIGMGYNANYNYSKGIGIGEAQNNNTYGIGIGYQASNNYGHGIGIGFQASNNNNYALGIGYRSQHNKPYSTSVGGYTFSASSSVSLGWGARSEQVDSVSLGAGAKTTAEKSTSIGSYVINDSTGTARIGVGINIPRDYIELGQSETSQATYIMLKSPDGTEWYLWVDDTGSLQITSTKP